MNVNSKESRLKVPLYLKLYQPLSDPPTGNRNRSMV